MTDDAIWIAWIALSPFLVFVAIGAITTSVVLARVVWEACARAMRLARERWRRCA